MLRLIKHTLKRFFSGITFVFNVFCYTDQLSLYGIFFYYVCIIFYIRRCRHRGYKIPDKIKALYLRRNILLFQAVLQSDKIYRHSLRKKLHHCVKNYAVLLMIKIILYQKLTSCYYRILAHDHRSHDRLLCLKTVRHYPLYKCLLQRKTSYPSTTETVSFAVTFG